MSSTLNTVALSYHPKAAELSQHSCLVELEGNSMSTELELPWTKGQQQPSLVGYLVACKGSWGEAGSCGRAGHGAGSVALSSPLPAFY